MSVTTRRLRETLVRERGWFRRERARAEAAEDERNRLEVEVKSLNEEGGRLVSAWLSNWDCSASPGHEGMHDAIAACRKEWKKP